MSDEHLYSKMEEAPDEIMLIDATGLGSELEIATECEDPPLTMHLSNLPIRDGLDIGHDGGGNETSDDDSLDSYLQSPNQTYDDGIDSRHDEDGSSSDGSVEYPSFSMQPSHLSFKSRLEYVGEEHGYGMSDEDSSESQPLSTKSSNPSDEGRMDIVPDKGEKTISNTCGVSYRPFIVNLSFKNTVVDTHDKDDCKNTSSTSLNILPNKNAEVSCLAKKDVLDHKQDKEVVETSSSDSAEFSFSPNIPRLLDKDELSITNEGDSSHIGTEYENIKSSSPNKKSPIAFNEDSGGAHKGGEAAISDISTLVPKPLKLSHLSNDELDFKDDKDSKSASDDINIKANLFFKTTNSPAGKTLTDDKVSENCKLELSSLIKKSLSLSTENKLDILHENLKVSASSHLTGMSVKNELSFSCDEQNKISNNISIEPSQFKTKPSTMSNENQRDLPKKRDISSTDTNHSTTSEFDNVNTSLLSAKPSNVSSVDRLDSEVSTKESKALKYKCIESHNLPSDNRLNTKQGTNNSKTLSDEEYKGHSEFSRISENKFVKCGKENNEIPSSNMAELSFKSPSMSIEETMDTSNKSDNISNEGVETSPITLGLLNDKKFKNRNSKDDDTSSNDGDPDTELHGTKLFNEGEKDVKDGDNINSDAENAETLPLIMKSSNVNIDNELDFMHDRGGNESSDEENSEPPKKKLKGIDSNNTKSSKKVRFDSDNSASYDGFNYQFSSEEKRNLCSEMDYDNIGDNLNSNHAGMMEFDILDEFESNDNDNDNDDRYSDCESDISLDELDAMLEAGFQNPTSTSKEDQPREESLELEEKEKVILKVRGKDHFDVLPEGWVEVTHNSGMPIYLHRASRVCCVSKPYFLGPGSTRKHEIPVSAIPCLNYLRELEKEKNQAQEAEDKSKDGEKFPPAKLECVKETRESGSLDYLAVREYCRKRFEFQTITVKKFKTWAGRRRHQKQVRLKQRPSLPDNTKLITCPLPPASDKTNTSGAITKKEFIMNPSGKSPVCILHEYVQHTLRVQPRYIFKELENASTPYGAVVVIGGIEYGSGYGSSKKQAKSEAAKAALDVLIPKMKMFPPDDPLADIQEDVEFFDQVRVEDPRVSELSIKAGQPYPFQILLECLKRNYGMGDTEIDITMKNLKHQKNEFIMKVGKHSVSVICKNKRDGKHRASQAILQLLHPHITTWGSLLRMYGKGSCKTLKEKKEEEQRITELQSQACANKPNLSILRKLKEEMLKYREKMKMKKPIGKLIPEHLELSTSDSNLKNVEL